MLFDLYGGLLTVKQREIFELYHSDDLSLGEIAENLGISRQGVRDALVRSETTLNDAETALGFLAEHQRRSTLLQSIKEDVRVIRRSGYDRLDRDFAAALSGLESKLDALIEE
jgi:predicted DNA-binding protein YlxM (UPF0122 family)